ncbi:hypothetical protein [uncultured Mediterranean phage uvMED]|nr:hypothetical protein [uncultured Mediterranean phage uvMED]
MLIINKIKNLFSRIKKRLVGKLCACKDKVIPKKSKRGRPKKTSKV